MNEMDFDCVSFEDLFPNFNSSPEIKFDSTKFQPKNVTFYRNFGKTDPLYFYSNGEKNGADFQLEGFASYTYAQVFL